MEGFQLQLMGFGFLVPHSESPCQDLSLEKGLARCWFPLTFINLPVACCFSGPYFPLLSTGIYHYCCCLLLKGIYHYCFCCCFFPRGFSTGGKSSGRAPTERLGSRWPAPSARSATWASSRRATPAALTARSRTLWDVGKGMGSMCSEENQERGSFGILGGSMSFSQTRFAQVICCFDSSCSFAVPEVNQGVSCGLWVVEGLYTKRALFRAKCL